MPFLFAQLNTPMPVMANTAPTKLLKQSIVVAMLLLIVGCKGFLSPHKIAIQQGNIVTKDMMDKLKVGMTPRQVRYVLGTPLVVDALHDEHWHYLYSLRLADGTTMAKSLTLTFDQGMVNKINTDYEFPETPKPREATSISDASDPKPPSGEADIDQAAEEGGASTSETTDAANKEIDTTAASLTIS